MLMLQLAFEATPERLAARPAHREFLASLHGRGILVGAGPFHDDSGALLLFDCDRSRLDEVLATDPYYATPGVVVVAVRDWRPIVGLRPS